MTNPSIWSSRYSRLCNDGAAHLKALAEVSRMFRDESSCAQLRGAKDAGALFALLSPIEERDAA